MTNLRAGLYHPYCHVSLRDLWGWLRGRRCAICGGPFVCGHLVTVLVKRYGGGRTVYHTDCYRARRAR